MIYFLPTKVYNTSKTESIYGYLTITRKQAESGLHIKLLKQANK